VSLINRTHRKDSINIRKEDSFTAVCIDSKGKVVPVLNQAPCHEDIGGVEV
jgi:hypothetical protein